MGTSNVLLNLFLVAIWILLGGCTSVNPNAVQDAEVTVFYNGIPFYLTDRNANKVNPILCQGEYYIPLEIVSKLAGYKVSYDSESSVIKGDTGSKRSGLEINYSYTFNGLVVPRGLNGDLDISKSLKVDRVSLRDGTHLIKYLYEELWVSVKDISGKFDTYIEFNTELKALNIYSEDFYQIIQTYRSRSDTKCKIDKPNLMGWKFWVLLNEYYDSDTDLVKFSFDEDTNQYYVVFDWSEIDNILDRRDLISEYFKDVVSNLNLSGLSNAEKVLKISQYICDNYVYESLEQNYLGSKYPSSMLEIIKSNSQICDGYARIFMGLCRAAELNCQYLIGYVNDPIEGPLCHAWNRVFIGDRWLYCDLTLADNWNDVYKCVLKTEKEIMDLRVEIISRIHY